MDQDVKVKYDTEDIETGPRMKQIDKRPAGASGSSEVEDVLWADGKSWEWCKNVPRMVPTTQDGESRLQLRAPSAVVDKCPADSKLTRSPESESDKVAEISGTEMQYSALIQRSLASGSGDEIWADGRSWECKNVPRMVPRTQDAPATSKVSVNAGGPAAKKEETLLAESIMKTVNLETVQAAETVVQVNLETVQVPGTVVQARPSSVASTAVQTEQLPSVNNVNLTEPANQPTPPATTLLEFLVTALSFMADMMITAFGPTLGRLVTAVIIVGGIVAVVVIIYFLEKVKPN